MTNIFLLVILCMVLSSFSLNTKPNIIFILGDDWGYSDIGYTGYNDIYTPNLDSLANEGIILFKYYSQSLCTPARAALLSGRYPANIGFQHDVWNPGDVWSITLDTKLLPEVLKDTYNYNTHMIGKWHLGFPSSKYIPVSRGFDSFYGYMVSEEDYYTKDWTYRKPGSDSEYTAYDFYVNDKFELLTDYSTFLYSDRILDVLDDEVNYDNDNPFFIYYAVQAIHSPNQAPDEYTTSDIMQNNNIESDDRVIKRSQAYIFDIEIGKLISKLKSLNIYDNTLIIFASDNGGAVAYSHTNYPLRGNKNTNYEGGHRVPAFISGGYITNKLEIDSSIYKNYFHVTDWYPTILSLIDNDYKPDNSLDGIDQSNIVSNDDINDYVNRNEILLNIDSYDCDYDYCGAVIYNKWKLLMGNYVVDTESQKSGWTPLIGQTENKYDTSSLSIDCNIADTSSLSDLFEVDTTACPWNGKACLYDLENDPCETNDVSSDYPVIYDKLLAKLKKYNDNMITAYAEQYEDHDDMERANPELYDNVWTPWQDFYTYDVTDSNGFQYLSTSTSKISKPKPDAPPLPVDDPPEPKLYRTTYKQKKQIKPKSNLQKLKEFYLQLP